MFRLSLGLLSPLCLVLPLAAADAKPAADKPQVEVVFCLDTTGSMGGLIEGAKQKIWAISNQIASGKPVPQLKIGLVAYRDRGDAYVTRVFDLTDDLDAVHGELVQFKADGGNDAPESVNQALNEAVSKIKWSDDKKTMKIIFLVGDAPPHMDYKDDVPFTDTCKKAVEKGIIINTVQCGGNAECQKFWQEICVKGEGTYVQIAQSGGVVAIATPFDKDLAELNTTLARATVTYGDAEMRRDGEAKREAAAGLKPAAAADRIAYFGKSGRTAGYDLIDAIRDKKVKLEELKDEQLPRELQNKTLEEKRTYLATVDRERQELIKKATELDKKRGEFIRQKLSEKKDAKDGFDTQVLEILRKQAKKFDINY